MQCLFELSTLKPTALWPQSVTEKKHSDKHHIFAPTTGARRTIFPKLSMVTELVEAIKKVCIHFSIQHIVFPTGCTEKFGLID